MMGAPEGAPAKGGGSHGRPAAAAPAHAGLNGGAQAAPAPTPTPPAVRQPQQRPQPHQQPLVQEVHVQAAGHSAGPQADSGGVASNREAPGANGPTAQAAPISKACLPKTLDAHNHAPAAAAAADSRPGGQPTGAAAAATPAAASLGVAAVAPSLATPATQQAGSEALGESAGVQAPAALTATGAQSPTPVVLGTGVLPASNDVQSGLLAVNAPGYSQPPPAATAATQAVAQPSATQAPAVIFGAAAGGEGGGEVATAAVLPAAAPVSLVAAPSAAASPALLTAVQNGAQPLSLGVMAMPWPGLLPLNGNGRPVMPLLRPVQFAAGFAAGLPPLAAAAAAAQPPAPTTAGTAAAADPGVQRAVAPAVVQPAGTASDALGLTAVQPAAGDKRKADVALGQPLAPPPPMAPPPVLGIPMLPPPVNATAVLGQPLNGPPPLGPLPLFSPMGAATPGAAAGPLAAGVPSSSANPEPRNEVGVEEDQPAGETGGSGRKSRLVWTQELHNRFINALSHLGLKNAVPKSILALMNVEGMTRENVASHLQKYRLYLRRLGGLSDRDRVDADALQRLHEQNVQQMAAQQVLQHSLVAMQGPHPGVLAAMGIGMGGPAAPVGGYPLLPLPPHTAAAAGGHAAQAAMLTGTPAAAAGAAAAASPGLATAGPSASQPTSPPAAAGELPGVAGPDKPDQLAANGATPPHQRQWQAVEHAQLGEVADTHSSLAALAEAAEAEAAQGSGSFDVEAAQDGTAGPARAPGAASGAGATTAGGSGPADRPQLTVSTSSGPAAAMAAAPATAAAAPATPTDRQ